MLYLLHLKPRHRPLLTLLFDLFLLWVVYHYALGGWPGVSFLLNHAGIVPWLVLALVCALLLYRSDYRMDAPLFLAGILLGYWGEWWGTTRGVWTYWNGAQPPDYLPPLWGLGLITVFRLGSWLQSRLPGRPSRLARWVMGGSLVLIPFTAFAASWPQLLSVDWRGRLDGHFLAGIAAAGILLGYRFELTRVFSLFVCGTLLGGFYEALGTTLGEWVYITAETPPLWIAPLWGLAAAAMASLARGMLDLAAHLLRQRPSQSRTSEGD